MLNSHSLQLSLHNLPLAACNGAEDPQTSCSETGNYYGCLHLQDAWFDAGASCCIVQLQFQIHQIQTTNFCPPRYV